MLQIQNPASPDQLLSTAAELLKQIAAYTESIADVVKSIGLLQNPDNFIDAQIVDTAAVQTCKLMIPLFCQRNVKQWIVVELMAERAKLTERRAELIQQSGDLNRQLQALGTVELGVE